jgi:hypothetical protein
MKDRFVTCLNIAPPTRVSGVIFSLEAASGRGGRELTVLALTTNPSGESDDRKGAGSKVV